LLFQWRDKYIMVLSILLATAMWLHVTIDRNPLTEQVFAIPLQASNLAGELTVDGLPGTVDVRVQGTRGQLAGISSADFKAVIDFDGVEPGQFGLPVSVSAPTGVQMSVVRPSRVEVVVDRLAEKQVRVLVNVKGAPAPGYFAGEPVLEPSVVQARGPARWLEEVNQVVVTVDLEGAGDVVDTMLAVSTGLDRVRLSPENVRVVVPVNALQPAQVAVSPRLSGSPAQGYHVTGVTVRPETVQVLLPPGTEGNIQPVATETINITGVVADVTRQVGLIAPPGTQGAEPGRVEVVIRVEPIPETGSGGNNGGEPPPPEEH